MIEKENIVQEDKEYDLKLGYITTKTKHIHHEAVKEIIEQGHYVTIQEYENGGKDVEWVIDIPGVAPQDAYDETIEYKVYIPYTEEELQQIEYKKEYQHYQKLLSDTDYKAIKFAEGWYTVEEYQPIKELREEYRQKIRELEELIK